MVVPSAVTLSGLADTVDVVADGETAVKVTVAVLVTFTVPFTTALITELPDVVDLTVPVI